MQLSSMRAGDLITCHIKDRDRPKTSIYDSPHLTSDDLHIDSLMLVQENDIMMIIGDPIIVSLRTVRDVINLPVITSSGIMGWICKMPSVSLALIGFREL